MKITDLCRRGVGVVAAAFFAISCGSNDSRLGEDGRIRLTGGEGCSSSTTLAVAAQTSLHIESASEDPLPDKLGARSANPDVISAHMGLEPASVDLHAHQQGDTKIQILSDGDVIDSLAFGAEPAAIAKHSSVSQAFAGGAADVLVTDVFSACGENEDCRLLGHGFLGWRVDPAELGTFVIDFDAVATFRMSTVGPATLIGQEPVTGSDLVSQSVEVVAVTDATGLEASLKTISFDPDVSSVDAMLPTSITRPDAFSVRLDGVLGNGNRVPISRRDVVWHVQGAEIVVEAPSTDSRDPLVTVFVPAASGTTTLVANVAILTLEQSFELTFTD